MNTTDEAYAWPGDEWGDAGTVTAILDTCVSPYLSSEAARFCEIASGAGRFTQAVLAKYSGARIDCFDISQAFLDQMHARFSTEIAAEQIRTSLLTKDPRRMYSVLESAGLRREIDCIFSFDAMVHVELHSIAIYVATAAAVLKVGGLLSMSVADAANPYGFQKLLHNAPAVFRQGGQAGMHFQFMSKDILQTLLTGCGFSYDLHDCNGRDLFFSARLDDPDAAQATFRAAGSGWWLHP